MALLAGERTEDTRLAVALRHWPYCLFYSVYQLNLNMQNLKQSVLRQNVQETQCVLRTFTHFSVGRTSHSDFLNFLRLRIKTTSKN
jgi:hypothetical protein